MVYLYLSNIQLTGEIDLTHLPDRVVRLEISNNQFTGGIDLTRLPDGMIELPGSSLIMNISTVSLR